MRTNHLTIVFLFVSNCDSLLIRVGVLSRHGDRTPYAPWSRNDTIRDKTEWPEGWGSLTLEGKRRMYSIGLSIRQRYCHFLSNDTTEVRARSSESERCFSSIESVLTGIYPPTMEISPGLQWQPISIKIDSPMLYESAECSQAEIERESIRQHGPEAEFSRKNDFFYHYLTELSGRNITHAYPAYDLYDRLRIAINKRVNVPEWINSTVMERLHEIYVNDLYFNGCTKKMQRLRSGVFFVDLLDQFSNKWTDKKLLIYSSHDVTLAIALQAMGLYNKTLIEFGASIYFELHSKLGVDRRPRRMRDLFVRMFFLNDSMKDELQQLIPPGCSRYDCPISMFANYLKPILVKNYTNDCNAD